jgi:hypothetical protein
VQGPSPTASAGRGPEHFDSDGFLDPEVEFSDASQFPLDSCPRYHLHLLSF